MFIAHNNEIIEGTYKPISQYQNKKVLTKSNGEVFTVSNICPHQLSLISTHPGIGNRTCPYHGWSFDINGNPLSSGRTEHYCINEHSLKRFEIYQWNNLVFDIPINCDQLKWLDLSNMQLVEHRIDRVKASSKNIVDVFLDVDHIECVHSGVYDLLGLPKINQVEWHYYDWGSLQLVTKKDSYGAAWLTVYPGTMIEWQEGALFVTETVHISDNETDVHVFKYCDDESKWQINETVWETAWAQDKAQAELLTGFANKNLEESKKHFRQWLSK